MDKRLSSLEQIKIDLADLEQQLEQNVHPYGAIVSFDFSKRKANRDNRVMTFPITGDDFKHALEEFKNRDESSGLIESDFFAPVLNIELEVSY